MHASTFIMLGALVPGSLAIAGCSTGREVGNADTGSIYGTLVFEHTAEKRPDGKTKLTVLPVAGFGQDEAAVDEKARAYAESVAKRACPKGTDFYADAPLKGRKAERTYVFKCK